MTDLQVNNSSSVDALRDFQPARMDVVVSPPTSLQTMAYPVLSSASTSTTGTITVQSGSHIITNFTTISASGTLENRLLSPDNYLNDMLLYDPSSESEDPGAASKKASIILAKNNQLGKSSSNSSNIATASTSRGEAPNNSVFDNQSDNSVSVNTLTRNASIKCFSSGDVSMAVPKQNISNDHADVLGELESYKGVRQVNTVNNNSVAIKYYTKSPASILDQVLAQTSSLSATNTPCKKNIITLNSSNYANSSSSSELSTSTSTDGIYSWLSATFGPHISVYRTLFAYSGFAQCLAAFSLTEATINCLSTFLSFELHPYFSSTFIGWNGIIFIVSAVIGSTIFGILVDKTKYFRLFLWISIAFSLLGLVGFTCMIDGIADGSTLKWAQSMDIISSAPTQSSSSPLSAGLTSLNIDSTSTLSALASPVFVFNEDTTHPASAITSSLPFTSPSLAPDASDPVSSTTSPPSPAAQIKLIKEKFGLVMTAAIAFMGFFLGPIQPIAVELACEVIYPHSESEATGLLQLVANIVSAVYLPLSFSFRDKVTKSMLKPNIMLSVLMLIVTACFLTFNGKYRRYEHECEILSEHEHIHVHEHDQEHDISYGNVPDESQWAREDLEM
jgi:hypothetical protein